MVPDFLRAEVAATNGDHPSAAPCRQESGGDFVGSVGFVDQSTLPSTARFRFFRRFVADLRGPRGRMGNCCSRSASTASSSGEPSRFRGDVEDLPSSAAEMGPGSDPGVRGSTEPKSEYFSARVEAMIESRSQFSSDVEHEIAHSQVHWSELSDVSNLSEDYDYSEVDRENVAVFQELMSNPDYVNVEMPGGHFFNDTRLDISTFQKIAEGGQAEIFETSVSDEILFKVFKRGSRLSDLRRQWPRGILRLEVPNCVVKAFLLNDMRFAFGMSRGWGDLRKLIDQAMLKQHRNYRLGSSLVAPFPCEWNGKTVRARQVMSMIALHMDLLHDEGILHRDLKAANVLLMADGRVPDIIVADFESSIGVVGTTFWRAPEILLALRNRTPVEFSQKADVYSYAMTCFEIVSGRLPFEGELEVCRASYDLVIEGRRPKLPSDLDADLRDVIERCWDPIPELRPSFYEVSLIIGVDW